MLDLWSTLVPLIIGSAVVPVQIVLTIMLLRTSLRTASAWVGGMAAVRLVQGILFGFVFTEIGTSSAESGSPGLVASALLLLFTVLFYVTAIRALLAADDEDAPAPKWMSKLDSMSAPSAFGFGAGYVAISPKFWVFTLGAIGAIADAQLGSSSATLTFVAFVTLALSVNLVILGYAAVSPSGSAVALERFAAWLQGNNRVIKIVLGVVFGTWFLIKALSGFGII
jgi:hypothetical protein